jgi:AraC-like DNA-binding protein
VVHVLQPVRRVVVATEDRAVFAASPVGRCILGPGYAIWCAAPDLHGSILWGSLQERSIRDMMEIGAFIHRPEIASRRRSLTDCRELERADADVLLGFIAAARENVSSWTDGVERQALVVPPGVGGVMISGVLPMAGVAHALRVTHEIDEALAFLEHPLAQAAHAEASSFVEAARGTSMILARLRAQLKHDLACATIERSAVALGMSTRTLQRELHRLGTSFSDELRRVRVETAQLLLVQTDLKIEAIATQVGFGRASRMSASLRRELNATASELRERRAP